MKIPERIPDDLIACEYCDLLQRERELHRSEKARCPRCGGTLYTNPTDALERSLALAIAAVALYLVANVFPFMQVSLEGQVQSNTISTGVLALWNGGDQLLALLILFTTILAPFFQLAAMLYVLLPLRLGWLPPGVASATRFQESMGPWAMLDVYMLALLVTLIKLGQMAHVELRVGAWAFIAFFVTLILTSLVYDDRQVWRRVEALG